MGCVDHDEERRGGTLALGGADDGDGGPGQFFEKGGFAKAAEQRGNERARPHSLPRVSERGRFASAMA